MPDHKRTILITGSTDGIGRQAAADLAAHSDNFVIIHGRSEEKCLAAKEFIANECGGIRTNVDFVVADLSVLSEVVELANEVERRFPSLNVLLCNAGVLNQRRLETKDGLEMMFQINYLSHFYLCHLLLPLLERQQHSSRILIIGSVLHSWSSLDWNDFMAEKEYEKYLQFSRTKLMLHLFAFTLHRRMVLSKKNVTVNVIELGKEKEPNNNGKLKIYGGFTNSLSNLSLCRQASAMTQIIENPNFNKVSGKYLDTTGKQLRSGQVATDERTQERLWDASVELLASLGHTIV